MLLYRQVEVLSAIYFIFINDVWLS